MWYDIQKEHIPEPNHKDCQQIYKEWFNLKEEEKSYRGFQMFMISHYFMLVYDKTLLCYTPNLRYANSTVEKNIF